MSSPTSSVRLCGNGEAEGPLRSPIWGIVSSFFVLRDGANTWAEMDAVLARFPRWVLHP
jgi:hypothetical protein